MNKDLIKLLQALLYALNKTPRFPLPALPKEYNDSYKLAAQIEAVLKAENEPFNFFQA